MKLPAFNKKAALIATAIGTVVISNVATYDNAYSGGYKTSITESRVGYMKKPQTSGIITVEVEDGKKVHYFTEFKSRLQPDIVGAWNSDKNRKFLEWSITTNAKRGDKPVAYASAACTPPAPASSP